MTCNPQTGWYVVERYDDETITLAHWECYLWRETAEAAAARYSLPYLQFSVCYYDGKEWKR